MSIILYSVYYTVQCEYYTVLCEYYTVQCEYYTACAGKHISYVKGNYIII